ncbi:hypothetical protein Trydic_g15845 [Trypoxylus dichotomus]
MFEKVRNFTFVSVFLLNAVLIKERTAVKITKLDVPAVVQKGTPTVLDCQYILDADTEQGLILKWYFNTDSLVYEWIPGKKPQVFGVLKGKLSNETSEANYRALNIGNPDITLTGNYTCTVSTFTGEYSETKRMLVFAPPTDMELAYFHSDYNILEVNCTAHGVYPIPKLTVFADKTELVSTDSDVEEIGGYFSVELRFSKEGSEVLYGDCIKIYS